MLDSEGSTAPAAGGRVQGFVGEGPLSYRHCGEHLDGGTAAEPVQRGSGVVDGQDGRVQRDERLGDPAS